MVVEINQKEGMTYYIHVQQLYDMARLSLERVFDEVDDQKHDAQGYEKISINNWSSSKIPIKNWSSSKIPISNWSS